MPRKPSGIAPKVRMRENQRNARARKKELIDNLKTRIEEYEKRGVQASQEMQSAAHHLIEENRLLKALLVHRGASMDEIAMYLAQARDSMHKPWTLQRSNTMTDRNLDIALQPAPAQQTAIRSTPSHRESFAYTVDEDHSLPPQSPAQHEPSLTTRKTPAAITRETPKIPATIAVETHHTPAAAAIAFETSKTPANFAIEARHTPAAVAIGSHSATQDELKSASDAQSKRTTNSCCAAPSSITPRDRPTENYLMTPASTNLLPGSPLPTTDCCKTNFRNENDPSPTSESWIQCSSAAAILAGFRGHGDAQQARMELNCDEDADCAIPSAALFRALDTGMPI